MHDNQWDAGTPATPGAYQALPYDQVAATPATPGTSYGGYGSNFVATPGAGLNATTPGQSSSLFSEQARHFVFSAANGAMSDGLWRGGMSAGEAATPATPVPIPPILLRARSVVSGTHAVYAATGMCYG
eukprot:1183776-Rhodomonas_salina.1